MYNLLNAKMSEIDYYFASRLPGEPVGVVEDIQRASGCAADATAQHDLRLLIVTNDVLEELLHQKMMCRMPTDEFSQSSS